MRLFVSKDVLAIFQIESEQFRIEKICLIPGSVEGERVWAMLDARTASEAVLELKAGEMSIWILERCVAELDGQVIVRGRRGFVVVAMTDSLRWEATQFVD